MADLLLHSNHRHSTKSARSDRESGWEIRGGIFTGLTVLGGGGWREQLCGQKSAKVWNRRRRLKTAIANEHWFQEVGQCLKAPQDQVQEDKGDDKRIFSMIGQDAERLQGSYITQPLLCQFIIAAGSAGEATFCQFVSTTGEGNLERHAPPHALTFHMQTHDLYRDCVHAAVRLI